MTKSIATLIIYAYSSFATPSGAGPAIVKNFEKTCQCKVLLINAGDGGSLLSRIKLEGGKSKADMIVGLDESFLGKLKTSLNWEGAEPQAFNKGPLAFVYHSNEVAEPPTSLDDLLLPQWKKQIVVQDPRLSTTGLNFLLWVITEKGEEGAWEYLDKLKDQVKVITPSWDLAYGLFKKKQTKLVLSYWTSPAYHIQEEKDRSIKAAPFKNGNFEQIEYAVVNSNSAQQKLAKDFMKYLLSEDAQKIIASKNFMYPVSDKTSLPAAYAELGRPPKFKAKRISQSEIEKNLERWLKKWREIFS